MQAASSNKKITVPQRVDLLEVALHYLAFYQDIFTNTKILDRSPSKAKKLAVLSLFDTQICKDMKSTFYSLTVSP